MTRDLYKEVTDRILADLKQGAAPWVRPWSAFGPVAMPRNAVTGRYYSGANVFMLWFAAAENGWSDSRYLTFRQAKNAGGNVRKGEHGAKVYFVKTIVKRDRAANGEIEEKKFGLLREYTVFNVAQCEGLPAKLTEKTVVKVRNPDERDAEIDEFIAATGVEIRIGGDRAAYSTQLDLIRMPDFAHFKNAASHYATTFHELGHSTGHKDRLNRDLNNRFGDRAYAAEELVAEITSAFLCAEFGLQGELRHAGYIDNWISLLSDDPKAFFTAASKATQAAEWLRGKALAEEADEEVEAEAA